jgi:hypothetical protein
MGGELHQQQVETMPYITEGIFEVHETFGVISFTTENLFVHFDLCVKVIIYVKKKGVHLNILINALINIVSCVVNARYNGSITTKITFVISPYNIL